MKKINNFFVGIIGFFTALFILGGLFWVVDKYLLDEKYASMLTFIRDNCYGNIFGFLLNSDDATKNMRNNSDGLHYILFVMIIISVLFARYGVEEFEKSHNKIMGEVRSKYNKQEGKENS